MNVRGLLGRRKFFLQYRLNQASSRLTCCVCWVLIAAKIELAYTTESTFFRSLNELDGCSPVAAAQALKGSGSLLRQLWLLGFQYHADILIVTRWLPNIHTLYLRWILCATHWMKQCHMAWLVGTWRPLLASRSVSRDCSFVSWMSISE